MSRRAIALRLVIAVSLAATVATSRIPDEIEVTTEGLIYGPVGVISIVANETAAVELTSLELDIEVVSSTGDVDLVIVPKDESLEPFRLPADTLVLFEPCSAPGFCLTEFSVEVGGTGSVTLSVTARIIKGSSLDDFSPEATLEVSVETIVID
jgi:hypothetical protein